MGSSEPRLLTPAAAAKRTGLPVSVIRRAMAEGVLTYLQPHGGRGWRLIPLDALDAWMTDMIVPGKFGDVGTMRLTTRFVEEESEVTDAVPEEER